LGWHGRLFLADVFESPSIPEIEPSLSRLLKDEAEDDLRVDLGCAMAVLGTPSSQSTARAVYRECPDDPEHFFIAETLYYQFGIQGIDDPDLAARDFFCNFFGLVTGVWVRRLAGLMAGSC